MDYVHMMIDQRAVPILTDWSTYTPTFTGFGTVSVFTCRWRRFGDGLDLDIQFVAGVTTAVEARVSIPSGITSDSNYHNPSWVGNWGFSGNTAASFGFAIEASKTYIVLTDQGGATNGLAKLNGNTLGTGYTLSGFVRDLKITEWTSFS